MNFRACQRLIGFAFASAAMLLSGCGAGTATQTASSTAASALAGQVHGGQQPVAGAQVYLYAVSSQNGGTATSLLNAPGFVLTDLNGNFTITNDYTCPAGAYVYLLALNGNPGLTSGVNTKIALAAGLGPCSSLSASSFYAINEVTTAAFASAIAGYATSAAQIGTTANLAATFAYVNTLVNPATGMANASQGSLSLPQQTVNALANSLAACVNSDGNGTSCSTLMTSTNASPANTFQAALNIAKSPAANVGAVFGLGTPNAVFQPTLVSAPASWTLSITTTSGQIVADANTYMFTTPVGTMCVEMRPDAAPLTVANFRYYVNNGSYSNGMFLHRSVPGFVIQGGGYAVTGGSIQTITTTSPVVNEYNLPNTRGTLSMATLYGQPNSATDQFFFNTADNSAALNAQNGAYTVFGSVVGVVGYTAGGCSSATAGLAVMDAINALQTYDMSASFGPSFSQLPLINYTANSALTSSNFVITTVSPANPQ